MDHRVLFTSDFGYSLGRLSPSSSSSLLHSLPLPPLPLDDIRRDATQTKSPRTRAKERNPYPEDERSHQAGAQEGSGGTPKALKNPRTGKWYCSKCENNFSGQYEADRHIRETARCTGSKSLCQYCGRFVNRSTNSKSRHLRSNTCKAGAKAKGIKHPTIEEAFK